MVEGAWTAFPDYHEEVREVIAEDDRVVLHLTISGTQRGQWGPLPPNGKRAEFDEIVILQIREGTTRRRIAPVKVSAPVDPGRARSTRE